MRKYEVDDDRNSYRGAMSQVLYFHGGERVVWTSRLFANAAEAARPSQNSTG